MKVTLPGRASNIEWPTVGLLSMNYVLWGACLLGFNLAPLPSSILMCIVLTLHSSLTHELVHGHPTRSNAINLTLGLIPLTLFYPIHLFQETHLKHHEDLHLTAPGIDPESFFCCPVKWQSKSKLGKLYAWINMTLAGRLLFSVPNTLGDLCRYCIRDVFSGNCYQRTHWVLHFILLTLIVTTLINLQTMPLGVYILCASIGHSTIALRAFFEHRPALAPEHRIVVVNSNWFFRLIYLGNNLHAVHHQYPGLPWYRIAGLYEENQTHILDRNDGFYFRGYLQWLGFLFRPIHSPVHPAKPERDI